MMRREAGLSRDRMEEEEVLQRGREHNGAGEPILISDVEGDGDVRIPSVRELDMEVAKGEVDDVEAQAGRKASRKRSWEVMKEAMTMNEDKATKSFRKMNIPELRAEVAGHGEMSRHLKKKWDYVELLGALGRAKYAHKENEPLQCGLSDELWSVVTSKLQGTDVKSLIQLGKTCRQLRRVTHKSGLWAWLVTILVNGTTFSKDRKSAILKNGYELSYDMCEEAVHAIEAMLPKECFQSLVQHGKVLPLRRESSRSEEFHERGFLSRDADNLQYIFKLGRSDIRLIQEAAFSATKGINNWSSQSNAMPAPLVLELHFRRVRSPSCIQSLKRGVIQRRLQFASRCEEFEMCARMANLALPLKDLHRAQKNYASEKKSLSECMEVLERDQQDILARNREDQVVEILSKQNLKLNALSTCCSEYIQGKNPSLSLEDLVARVRETTFYNRHTMYPNFRLHCDHVDWPSSFEGSRSSASLDTGEGCVSSPSMSEIIDICLSDTQNKWDDMYGSFVVPEDMIFDDVTDWTTLGKKIKRLALFWYLQKNQQKLDPVIIPPSVMDEAEDMLRRMKELSCRLNITQRQIQPYRHIQVLICKIVLLASDHTSLEWSFKDKFSRSILDLQTDKAESAGAPRLGNLDNRTNKALLPDGTNKLLLPDGTSFGGLHPETFTVKLASPSEIMREASKAQKPIERLTISSNGRIDSASNKAVNKFLSQGSSTEGALELFPRSRLLNGLTLMLPDGTAIPVSPVDALRADSIVQLTDAKKSSAPGESSTLKTLTSSSDLAAGGSKSLPFC